MVKIKFSKKLQEYYDDTGILSFPDEILMEIFNFCGPLVCYSLKGVNKRFHRIIRGENFGMPKWINRFIQPYIFPLPFQFEVVKWMVMQKNGGILNMEMGLTKTNTCLTYINVSYALRNLVICCKSQMSVWRDEVKKFYGDNLKILLCHHEYDGDVKDFSEKILECYDIVVVTYQSAKHIVAKENPISKIFWNNVFCDEVHVLRNRPVSMYPYIETIQRTNFWGLTGSLIFNSISDARNIQCLIDPSSIYSTTNIKKLRFSDVNIVLPKLTINTISTDKTPRQAEIYKRYEDKATDLLEQLGSHSKNMSAIFTIIHRLRQISISLALLKASHSKLGELELENTYKSPRISRICDCIEGNDGQSVVFCFYKTTLDLVNLNLKSRGIKSVVIRSEQNLLLRNHYISQFVAKKYKCLLITYQCGAHGYNFTNANHVVLASPWWNFQIIQQAFKRVYRLGQEKPVIVDMFVSNDSIESRMVQLCTQKETIEEMLLADHKQKIKMTLDEIKKLF